MKAVSCAWVALCLFAGVSASGGPHWSYDPRESDGPSGWANISDGHAAPYAACAGQRQSPVNFVGTSGVAPDPSLRPLQPRWTPITQFDIVNDGHTVKVTPTVGGGSFVDPLTGREYQLAQFHFHAASEHTFGASYRDLEAHFVHTDAQNNVLVVGITLVVSSTGFNKELAGFWPLVAGATSTVVHTQTTIDLREIVPSVASYFTYDGSFTTPPCTEGVRWIVLTEPLSITQAMLTAIRSQVASGMTWGSQYIVAGNYRPTQPLHGRTIRLFSPTTVGLAAAGDVPSAVSVATPTAVACIALAVSLLAAIMAALASRKAGASAGRTADLGQELNG